MTRLYTFLCASILALSLAPFANAQLPVDGSQCLDCADAQDAIYLCGGQVSTSTDTECVIVLPERQNCRWMVRINKVQAGCPWTNMTIEESDQVTSGAPTVWHTVGVLTGPTSPSVSELVPLHTIGPALRATFVDITDAACTDVRVLARCRRQ